MADNPIAHWTLKYPTSPTNRTSKKFPKMLMNKKRKTEGFMYIIVAKRRNTKIILMNKLLFFGTITFVTEVAFIDEVDRRISFSFLLSCSILLQLLYYIDTIIGSK